VKRLDQRRVNVLAEGPNKETDVFCWAGKGSYYASEEMCAFNIFKIKLCHIMSIIKNTIKLMW
jgi:hypothetical protein